MSKQVDCKGASYAHYNGPDLKDFQAEASSEASICKADIYKIQAYLQWTELTSEKPRK